MPRTSVVVRKMLTGPASIATLVIGQSASVALGAVARMASSRRVPVGIASQALGGSLLPPVPRDFYLSVPSSLSGAEGSNVTVTVTSSIAFATNTLIGFTVTGVGGAQAGVDYNAPASPITLLAGQTSVNLVIQLLSDVVTDPNEIVRITWTSVTAV